jgi:hypothetical protein
MRRTLGTIQTRASDEAGMKFASQLGRNVREPMPDDLCKRALVL